MDYLGLSGRSLTILIVNDPFIWTVVYFQIRDRYIFIKWSYKERCVFSMVVSMLPHPEFANDQGDILYFIRILYHHIEFHCQACNGFSGWVQRSRTFWGEIVGLVNYAKKGVDWVTLLFYLFSFYDFCISKWNIRVVLFLEHWFY